MGKKLTRNIGLKIISLGIAFAVWLIIVNTYDPVTTATFRDIPVELMNEEVIRSLDQVYEVIQGRTVDVTVKGNRSIVDTIRPSDIKATADLSNISPTNNVTINLVCLKSSAVELSLGRVDMLKISLEDIASQQFKVTIVSKGTVADGYFVGNLKAKPNLIQVNGAVSQVERIHEIRVEVDVSNAMKDFRTSAVPKAYDKEGKEITAGSLTFSSEEIVVVADVLPTKEVPLKVITKGSLYNGYRHTVTEHEPQTVIIAGEQDVLDRIQQIEIPVSLENKVENVEETLSISDYLPEKVMLTNPDSTIVVKLTIEKMQTKELQIPIDQIEIRNLKENYECHYKQNTIITVNLQGLKADLNKVKPEDLMPYIDLKDLIPGEHSVTVQFEVPSGLNLVASPSLLLTIVDNTEEETEEENNQDTNGDEEKENTENNPEDSGGFQEVPKEEEEKIGQETETNEDRKE